MWWLCGSSFRTLKANGFAIRGIVVSRHIHAKVHDCWKRSHAIAAACRREVTSSKRDSARYGKKLG
jgi:hypothetical protein